MTSYKRQGHIHGPVDQYSSSSLPLDIILEEDESRSSSPTSSCCSISSSEGSSNLDIKARRRHATVSVSELRLSRVFPTEDSLLPSPRPPITSNPPASPDSFKLTFTDVSFKFPHPPIPTPSSLRKYVRHSECDSPTSSLSSSPASQTEAMPLTPSTSDDEFGPSTRRPIVQPLVITKHNPRPSSIFDDDCPISPSLLQPFKISTESSAPLSPLSPSYLPEAYFDESDDEEASESDSEWYSRELSKIISLCSPIPPSFPHQTSARPDSVSFSSSTTSRNRASKPLPPTPLSGGFPSPQLDPAYSRKRGSKRRSIPNYPPPPVPTISPTSSSSNSSSNPNRRPPPRSSIPADCVYDLVDIEEQDNSSTFSFSIYDVYLGDEPDLPSAYSQASFEEDPIDGVSFDLDSSMMLPLSLPTTPFDLEADIAQGLEQLKNSPVDGREFDFIVPEIPEQPQPQQQQQQVVDDIFSPTASRSPEERMLKSKWSTSTLGSIREEHEHRGPSSKLRLYFSPLKNHKHGSKKSTSNPSLSTPSPRRKAPFASTTPRSPPPPPPPARSSPSKLTQSHHIRGYSDVMVIGYGNNGSGVRRRGSITNSVSDAGSEESYSSTSSTGLRRKPIPVEMFLRSAV